MKKFWAWVFKDGRPLAEAGYARGWNACKAHVLKTLSVGDQSSHSDVWATVDEIVRDRLSIRKDKSIADTMLEDALRSLIWNMDNASNQSYSGGTSMARDEARKVLLIAAANRRSSETTG